MLDFRVETFLTVCETMNFTKAAHLLHITQPAVSQHIHALENQIDAKLFSYEGKQLVLTQAGMMFLQAATTMRHDAQKLIDMIHQKAANKVLHFGATLTIGEYLMPEMLMNLLTKEPDIQIRMFVSNTSKLIQMLDQGDIDFAIVEGFFPKAAYESIIYRNERFLPVCAADYTCMNKVECIQDLLSERLLIREAGSGTREMLERTLKEKNLMLSDFNHIVELGNLNTIKRMVCAGAGISFFYQPVVQQELDQGILREIKLKDFSMSHEFTFLWRKDSIYKETYHELYSLLCK